MDLIFRFFVNTSFCVFKCQ